MRLVTWTLMLLALLLLALPAVAGAVPIKAQLQAVTGSVTVKETRCAAGTTSNCGIVQLDETFKGGPRPKVRSGTRIAGQGSAKCYAESPSTIVTGPDGSVQFLSGAARLLPGDFSATRIAVTGTKRGIRVSWLEPLQPAVACDYFDAPGTAVALPAAQPQLPETVVSRRVLRRSRFSITIAGSQEWTDAAGDGTQIAGRATWKLRLDYKR